MNKAIVTFRRRTHREYLDIARPSFRAFAKRHGYDYFEADQVGRLRPPAWYKVQCLLDLLKQYDIAVFFGCDLVVVDGREDFPLADTDWWQAMVTHHTQCAMCLTMICGFASVTCCCGLRRCGRWTSISIMDGGSRPLSWS